MEWEFWEDWWRGLEDGAPLRLALQEKVALIPDRIWQDGAAAVAEEIRRIEAEFNRAPRNLDAEVAEMTPGSAESLAHFSRSAWKHREELPATLCAILGFCQLEIERLQGKNFQTDDERDEALRQISVLRTLYSAIERLAPLVNTDAPLSEVLAVEPEKLLRIAKRSVLEWPRKNIEDLVDSAYRVALSGAATSGFMMLGVPSTFAIAVSGAFFGGKKIADAIKAGSDSKGL